MYHSEFVAIERKGLAGKDESEIQILNRVRNWEQFWQKQANEINIDREIRMIGNCKNHIS